MGQVEHKEDAENYGQLDWREEKVPARIRSLQFKHCLFRASHNTYVEDIQIGGNASIYEVMRVVSKGCRVIELDLSHELGGDELVIGHSTGAIYGTTVVRFSKCCKALAAWAWKRSDYPLILCFDLNGVELEEVIPVLKAHFGKCLYTGPFTMDTKIEDLVGRVAVYPKGGDGFRSVGSNSLHTVVHHPESQVLRVYPNNVIHSTNYDPSNAFNMHAQVVAMNWNMEDAHLTKYMACIPTPIVALGV